MSTQTVGELLIDLRANVAQLKTDMDQVKRTLSTSSREINSQMKKDMDETRHVLALMRDDFGVGVPRELRKMIASSEAARTAILGLSTAFYGLAFLNIGVEAFKKISEHLDLSGKKAAEEAKATREIFDQAQKAAEATAERLNALQLIGKAEDERAAIQRKFWKEENAQATRRLTVLQADLAAKTALMFQRNSPLTGAQKEGADLLAESEGVSFGAVGQGIDEATAKKNLKDTEDLRKKIGETEKFIEETIAKLKTNDVQLADYERGLGVSSIKNWQDVAQAQLETRRDLTEKLYQEGKIALDQELITLRAAATQKYNINVSALQAEIYLLNQDPSRNREKLAADNAKLLVEWEKYKKDLNDITAKGIAERRTLREQELTAEAGLMRSLDEMAKNIQAHTGIGGLVKSMATGISPKAGGNIADFIQGRAAELTKNAAEQGKLLTKAYEDLLTPAQKFQLVQAQIADIFKQWKGDQPADLIKALNNQLLLADPAFQKLREASAEFGKDLANELGNLITGTENFHQMLQTILKDLENIALKALLLKPLENIFSGGNTGTGGIPGLFSRLFGAHAYGGRSDQVNLVGENGPELFIPDSAGQFVPNNALGGNVMNVHVDARGADAGVEVRVFRAMRKAMQAVPGIAITAVREYGSRR